MDGEGNVTTDPSDAINGVILPMAGHKGYAITFMMDVLGRVDRLQHRDPRRRTLRR